MKILIVGAGGVGGYFGAGLIKAAADITFLLREKRHRLIQENGLTVETPEGNFTITPKSVTADQLKPEYDLIILAPKAFDLEDSLASLEKASANGTFLPFLNGFNHLEVLDDKFGKARVMGGVAQIAAMITETGAVRRMTDVQGLIAGPRSPEHETLAREFADLCEKSSFNFVYSETIELALWEKWVFLATLAGMTTLCLGSVGDIVATPYGAELSQKMYSECCAIAAANGFPINATVQSKALSLLTKEGSIFTASMMRDLTSGQRTEHEHVLGDLIRKGTATDTDCDLMKIAYTHMAVVKAP
ncbi:2-dehydropantoate 2-reductase [Sneathiella sp.]|uniref:2-dehydropantoate 2-reductase n=1 Tax=Sneathiella sp. TaxID=1964365 RepID=UPI003562E9B4